jgi:outer membrane protein
MRPQHTDRGRRLAVVPPLAASLLALAAAFVLAAPAPASAQEQEPADGAPRALTLDEAIRIALTGSPELRRAQAERRRDEAVEWEGWDLLLPAVGFATGLNQSAVLQRTASDPITGGIVQLPDSLIQLRETYGTSATLSANWTLFDGGRNLRGLRRAQAEGRVADAVFDATRVRVAATVTLAYLDALEAEALERALRAEAERAAELERTAVGRFEVGEVPELDALQARLQASDAELSLMEAESQTHAARLALFEHVGIPPGDRVELREPDIADPSSLPSEDELRRHAMERSGDLAAQRARLSAAQHAYDAQRWWFVPSVSVGVSWVRSEFGQTQDAITFSPRNEQTFYQLRFGWNPLERPGGTVADRRRTSGSLGVAQAELEIREAALVRGVEAALDRLSRARVLRERSEVNLSLAERQREQADERYRLGVAPLMERLNAEALATEAERQAIVARYAALRAVAELEQAAGVSLRPLM